MTRVAMKKRWAGAKPCRVCGCKVIDTGRMGKWYDPKHLPICSKCYHKLEQAKII